MKKGKSPVDQVINHQKTRNDQGYGIKKQNEVRHEKRPSHQRVSPEEQNLPSAVELQKYLTKKEHRDFERSIQHQKKETEESKLWYKEKVYMLE